MSSAVRSPSAALNLTSSRKKASARHLRAVEASSEDDGQDVRLLNYHDCGAEIFIGWGELPQWGNHRERLYFAGAGRGASLLRSSCPECGGELNAETVTFYLPGEPRLQSSFYNPNEVGPRRKHGEAEQVKRIRPHETWGEFAMHVGEVVDVVSIVTPAGSAAAVKRQRHTCAKCGKSFGWHKHFRDHSETCSTEAANLSLVTAPPAGTVPAVPAAKLETDDEETARLFAEYKACGNVYQVALLNGLGEATLFNRLRDYARTGGQLK